MQEVNTISIISERKKLVLNVSTILYVIMSNRKTEIHVSGGHIYATRMHLDELEAALGDGFLKVHRGCIVSVMAIHDITDTINLSNGEHLDYTKRKKKELIEQLGAKQQRLIRSFKKDATPQTEAEYRQYYACFDRIPIAFTDIEMVFNEESHAVDWVFRYANSALARLEKMSPERLLGSSFGSLFSNMDTKWLRCYERVALYGEILEVIDYSPEIDTYLKVICFPTFKGHCGCILFDINSIKVTDSSRDTEKALLIYLEKLMHREA